MLYFEENHLYDQITIIYHKEKINDKEVEVLDITKYVFGKTNKVRIGYNCRPFHVLFLFLIKR